MQQAYQQQQATPAAQQQRQAAAQAAASQEEEAAAHTENEWGIEVVPESSGADAQQQQHGISSTAQQHNTASSATYDHSLPEGLQYSLPVSCFTFVLHVSKRQENEGFGLAKQRVVQFGNSRLPAMTFRSWLIQ